MPLNPLRAADQDRQAIWDMLINRDIEAFVTGSWDAVASDFAADGFWSIDGSPGCLPEKWRVGFTAIDSYRESWLRQSHRLRDAVPVEQLREHLHEASTLVKVDVKDDVAVAVKRFDGMIDMGDEPIVLDWTTIYMCRRMDDGWRITGFVGYIPPPHGGKSLPPGARQHSTAGPYSPALVVGGSQLVVISGQASIADDGKVIGDDLDTQARVTLENCRQRLIECGSSLADVFKVNVYLADLTDWSAFNEVYVEMVPEPRPVRTAIGVSLLPGLMVEVEMWAVRP